jgi:hypothetical protein
LRLLAALTAAAAVLVVVAVTVIPRHPAAPHGNAGVARSGDPAAAATTLPTGAAQGAVSCPAGKLVTTAGDLTQALKSAAPGAVITLAPGIYVGHFVAAVSGTAEAPITVCGPREAVLDGGDMKSGYGFHVNGVSWWKLIGFTVQNSQKGVMTDHAGHVLISGLSVHAIGDEAIHLRSFSSDNVVENSVIRDTGHKNPKFGEGLYVGSAHKNWCKYSQCNPDTSDRNVLRNNDIANTTAENIDIKEGTTSGEITGNKLSGVGMVQSGATAWLNLKGNSWRVTGNTGEKSIKDGFQVHEILSGWGMHNVFQGNRATVDGPGFGFYVQHRSLAAQVSCDNVASGAARGLSNIGCG